MRNTAYLRSLTVKNFRCFSTCTFDFNNPVVVIEGANGSGKTSLIEAIHYACYMRSFRAHSPRDLIRFESDNFFINAQFNDHTISIGVMSQDGSIKRQVKVDNTAITSYKELRSYCRIITITEDDVMLIKGSPEKRRSFIDQALFLIDTESLELFKVYQEILDHRNALLYTAKSKKIDDDSLAFWTRKLWDLSTAIAEKRCTALQQLAVQASTLLALFWPESETRFEYHPKCNYETTFDGFITMHKDLFEKEKHFGRSLFGIHLDDIEIIVNQKKARYFSSRGQQKLLIMMLKIALIQHLCSIDTHIPIAFLLDDFTTDFDALVSNKLMEICIKLNCQLIFVSPLIDGPEQHFLHTHNIISSTITL